MAGGTASKRQGLGGGGEVARLGVESVSAFAQTAFARPLVTLPCNQLSWVSRLLGQSR